MKKAAVFLCTAMLVLSLAGNVWATLYEGNITSPSGGMNTHADWDGAILTWAVDDSTTLGFWTYRYTFTASGSPDPSHVIIEVSDNFEVSNIEEGTTSGYQDDDDPTTYGDQGNSNPGIPGDLFGIKWDSGFSEGLTWNWQIVTDRAPMWGDFYAKGGDDTYAYNSSFGGAISAAWDANPFGFVLVPDTHTTPVPEPATLLLLGTGLIGLAGIGRKKFKKVKISN